MWNLEQITCAIGIVGFSISAASYVLSAYDHAFRISHLHLAFVGMLMLVIGYIMLIVGEAREIAKVQREKAGEEHYNSSSGEVNYFLTGGYIVLFAFFAEIHFVPRLTYTVRFYDKFAAFGTLLRCIPLFATSFAGAFVMSLYYVFGMIQKFGERSLVDRMQLVGRLILIVYYALVIYMASRVAIESTKVKSDVASAATAHVE